MSLPIVNTKKIKKCAINFSGIFPGKKKRIVEFAPFLQKCLFLPDSYPITGRYSTFHLALYTRQN